MPFATKSYDDGIPYTQLFDYVSGSDPIYVGAADPGVATSAAKWKIYKLTYATLADSSNGVVSIKWANKSTMFDQIWDNRASYTYS